MQEVTADTPEVKIILGQPYIPCPHCGGTGSSGKKESIDNYDIPCRTCVGWGTVDPRRFPEKFK